MKKSFTVLSFFAALLFVFSQASVAQVKIDGNMSDWNSSMRVDTLNNAVEKTFSEGDPDCPDPSKPSYFVDMDIHHIYATDDTSFVYIQVQMNDLANVSQIATDTSYHGGGAISIFITLDPGSHDTTGLTWGWWGSGYDLMVQIYPISAEQSVYEQTQADNGYSFDVPNGSLTASTAWNSANNDCEVAIPRSYFNHPDYMKNFTPTDSIGIMIYAGENNSPWRADYASNPGIAGDVYYLKTGSVASILPVELTTFTASYDKSNISLRWSTATEINNSYFIIQRSLNNSTWENIGKVSGSGTSTNVHNYSFTDAKVDFVNAYYRIQQVDFNGSSNYSKSIEVNANTPVSYDLSQNYPNPFNPSTEINYSIPKAGFVTLSVYNMLGQKAATLISGMQEKGNHSIRFDGSSIPSGMYFYRLKYNGVSITKKMLLLK